MKRLERYALLSSASLVEACAGSRNQAAWEEFLRRFHPVIATVVLRTARRWSEPSPQTVDDLVQETYLKLCGDNCRLLRSFKPRHPEAIYGFLKVVAASVVHDHYKAARAGKRGAGQGEEPIDEVRFTFRHSPTEALDPMERRILLMQIEEALSRFADGEDQQRNRMIFWLYYRNGLSASAIASLPFIGLTTKGVESTILRMTRMLRVNMTASRSPAVHPRSED